MNKRIKNIVTVVLLAAFLFGFGAWAALKPADSLSLSERRRLKQLPAVRMDAVLSGKFMSDFEGYALDQFPLRDEWRTLKALNRLYVYRQKDNNGVYIKDSYAAKLEYPMNESSIDHAAERFRYLYENFMADAGARVYLSVIPDKNYFLAETNGYPAIDYEAFVEALREQTDFAQYIDLFGQLTLDDYYRTDSHWRQERLPAVAAYLAREMGVTLTDEYTEQVLDRPYYGVYYGYAALPMQPDELRYLTSETLEDCTVYNYETGKPGAVYDMEKGAGNDPYELFLSGSISLLSIENPNAETDRELIVFRDSFGSSLAPLLAEGYAKITLADIRYLPSSQMGKLLDFTDADVLAVHDIARTVSREAHHLIQFARLRKMADGSYYAPVSPKCNALPLAVGYFRDRFADQRWLVYDLKRRYGYAYDLHEVREVVFESLSDAPSERLTDDLLDADELAFQRLWKSYFDALAIPERFNPRLQRRQMPARFWKYLIEKE